MISERISSDLAKFGHIADLDFRVKAYKTSQWAFRWSNASLRGFELGATPRIPYYDIDLIDFFCTVPTSFVRDRRLQIDHLKRYAPDLARIRWQQGLTNLYLSQYGYWISAPRRAYAMLMRRLGQAPPLLERNWEVQFLSAAGEANLRAWFSDPNRAVYDVVEKASVSDAIDGFYQDPNPSSGYSISMLLTFAAWLEILS